MELEMVGLVDRGKGYCRGDGGVAEGGQDGDAAVGIVWRGCRGLDDEVGTSGRWSPEERDGRCAGGMYRGDQFSGEGRWTKVLSLEMSWSSPLPGMASPGWKMIRSR